MLQDAPLAAAPNATADLIKDVTADTFMQDVIEASQSGPVLVDFWSTTCGPCQTLMPILEKLVLQAQGGIKLVKINVDEAPEIAAQMQVRSVPTVFCFQGGRPVDAFQGALPESQLRQFIDKQMDGGSPIQQALAQAKDLMDAAQIEQAQQVYTQILQHDNANPEAIAGLMRCYLALDQADLAQQIADQLTDEMKKDDHIASALAALELGADTGVDTSAFEARLAANENDHEARFDLGMALYGAGQVEEGLMELLTIVKRDRTWNEDAARLQMLKIFEAVGLSDPVVIKVRKKLTTVMF